MTVRFITGGASNDLFEITRGGQRLALRRPPEPIPKGRNETMLREFRLLSALADTDVPHARVVARVRRHGGARRMLLHDGVRRRLVAHPRGHHLARALRERPRRPPRPRVRAGRGDRPPLEGRLASQGSRGFRPARRVPRAPGRPVALAPRRRAVPATPRHRRGGRVACVPTPTHLPARHHARRLPVRQRDVPPRGTRPARGHRRLGDGDGRGPAARPRMGDQRLARRPLPPRRGGGQLRGLHRHALRRPSCSATTRIAAGARSTRSTTTSSSPGSSWPSCSKRGTRGWSPARPTIRRWRPSATW